MCKHTGDVNAMGVGREQHGVVQATIYITVGTVIDGQEFRPFHRSKFRSMHSTRHCLNRLKGLSRSVDSVESNRTNTKFKFSNLRIDRERISSQNFESVALPLHACSMASMHGPY